MNPQWGWTAKELEINREKKVEEEEEEEVEDSSGARHLHSLSEGEKQPETTGKTNKWSCSLLVLF